jgi:hypothetical protein
MLFYVPFLADWTKMGEYRQHKQTKTLIMKIKAAKTGTINLVTTYW